MIAPGSDKNQIKVSAIKIMNHRWQLVVQLPLSQTTDLFRFFMSSADKFLFTTGNRRGSGKMVGH